LQLPADRQMMQSPTETLQSPTDTLQSQSPPTTNAIMQSPTTEHSPRAASHGTGRKRSLTPLSDFAVKCQLRDDSISSCASSSSLFLISPRPAVVVPPIISSHMDVGRDDRVRRRRRSSERVGTTPSPPQSPPFDSSLLFTDASTFYNTDVYREIDKQERLSASLPTPTASCTSPQSVASPLYFFPSNFSSSLSSSNAVTSPAHSPSSPSAGSSSSSQWVWKNQTKRICDKYVRVVVPRHQKRMKELCGHFRVKEDENANSTSGVSSEDM